MKRKEPLHVSEIIRRAIESSGSRDNFDRQRVCYLWAEVVGPSINRLTTRRWMEGDVLHVALASASLRNDLSFMASSLVSNLNKAAGASLVTRIVFH